MPLQYALDDTKRCVRLTFTDPLTVGELLASAERQLADGAWRYGVLVDARISFPELRPSELQSFVSGVRELIAAHGPRGPIAVVARESGPISSAQLYDVFGGKTESIEAFRDLDAAQQWLDERAEQAREPSETD